MRIYSKTTTLAVLIFGNIFFVTFSSSQTVAERFGGNENKVAENQRPSPMQDQATPQDTRGAIELTVENLTKIMSRVAALPRGALSASAVENISGVKLGPPPPIPNQPSSISRYEYKSTAGGYVSIYLERQSGREDMFAISLSSAPNSSPSVCINETKINSVLLEDDWTQTAVNPVVYGNFVKIYDKNEIGQVMLLFSSFGKNSPCLEAFSLKSIFVSK